MNETDASELKVRRIFISYSWTNDEYVHRVRELAEELANNGIDVELDQWSLKEGDDKFHYMELMVNDPTVDKVIILLDKKYKEKADDRKGGVGTEATILTPKVYADVVEKRGKQKFIPVVMERDPERGEEFVPTFLDGRKYVDLSDSENYAERFEELIRAIHNKPLHRKPQPGKIPLYLLADDAANTATGGRARRAIEFLAGGNPRALNSVKDYFASVSDALKTFDFPSEITAIGYEDVLAKIQEVAPIRDEVVDVFLAIAKYQDDPAFYEEIRNFFEGILPYFEFRNEGDSNHQWAADHFKFLAHELFLYAVAALLKFHRFTQINELTEQGYYTAGTRYSPNENSLLSYLKFNTYSEALLRYNQTQQRRYSSYDAFLINQRATRRDLSFEMIMQADFFLYVLYQIDESNETPSWYFHWYPSTLNHAQHRERPFEIFSRSQSKKFFERFQVALRGSTKEFLVELFKRLSADKNHSFGSFERRLADLSGADNISTRP